MSQTEVTSTTRDTLVKMSTLVTYENVSPPETRVGNLFNPDNRARAIEILKNGGTVQMISGTSEAGVGGIFFNILDPKAEERAVKLKSHANKDRHPLFGVMVTNEDMAQLSDVDINLDCLVNNPCFLLVPAKNASTLPEWASQEQSDGSRWIQVFPSDQVPGFKELVREAQAAGMRIGGTSQNLTKLGNLKTESQNLAFFHSSSEFGPEDMWLDTGAKATGDSWLIVKYFNTHPPTTQLIRPASPTPNDIEKYNHINESLRATPAPKK